MPTDFCVGEDQKRHVVAKVPGAMMKNCPDCTAGHWPKSAKWIYVESDLYDIKVHKHWIRTEPMFMFYNTHTVACLPKDEDVSKYNSAADVGDKFEVIKADHYYDFDRNLNSVWDT